jgi:hypothetical protein
MPTPNEDPLYDDKLDDQLDDPTPDPGDDGHEHRPLSAHPRQLSLFAPPSEPEPKFVRGVAVDRSGINRYIHIVRGPDDPTRSPRPKGGLKDRAPHRTFKKMPVDKAKELLLSLLSDGRPRTFNAMTIELFDLGADTLMGSPVDRALWKLVADERLEHTMTRPVLFRLAT